LPRDKNDSHVIILKNAKKEFLEFGFEKASMRSIAKKSGVTAGALYKHFAGKEEMFNALAEPVYKKLLSLFDKYTDSVMDDIEANSDELFDAQNIHTPTLINKQNPVIIINIKIILVVDDFFGKV